MKRSRLKILEVVVLLAIVAAAAGARVGYLVTYADQGIGEGPFQVQGPTPEVVLKTGNSVEDRLVSREIDVLAANLRENRWFGSPAPFAAGEEQTAHVAPAYPYLVAETGRIAPYVLPHDSTNEEDVRRQLVRWVQCGLGALTAGLYFLFARRAFGNWLVAILAGLFCALHPFWIVNTAELNDGVLASFLLAASLFLGVRAGKHAEPLTSFLYGVCLAGLALTRAALLPFAIVAMLWFLWRCRSLAQGWLAGALGFLGLVIGLTPWALRDFQTFGDGVPIVTTTYYHLWMGNNPKATGGPLEEETLLAELAAATKQDSAELAARLAMMPQVERYQTLARFETPTKDVYYPVLDEVTRDGPALATRRIWAGLYFFFGKDWFSQQRLHRTDGTSFEQSDLARRSLSLRLLAGSLPGCLFGMLILSILGWRWTFAWCKEAMPSSLAVFWIPLPYILGHAEALSGPRLPLDGVLLTYAAFALVCLVPGLGSKLLAGRPTDQQR